MRRKTNKARIPAGTQVKITFSGLTTVMRIDPNLVYLLRDQKGEFEQSEGAFIGNVKVWKCFGNNREIIEKYNL